MKPFHFLFLAIVFYSFCFGSDLDPLRMPMQGPQASYSQLRSSPASYKSFSMSFKSPQHAAQLVKEASKKWEGMQNPWDEKRSRHSSIRAIPPSATHSLMQQLQSSIGNQYVNFDLRQPPGTSMSSRDPYLSTMSRAGQIIHSNMNSFGDLAPKNCKYIL